MTEDERIKKSIKSSSNELYSIEEKLEKLEDFLGEVGEVSFDVKKQIYEESFEPLKPKVLEYLEANYDKSGIQTRTGTLLENIRRARVSIYFKTERSDPEIAIKMPKESDIKKYKDEKKDPYTVANALNFGAVRAPMEEQEIYNSRTRTSRTARVSVLNQNQKKKVKKKVLGYEVKDKSFEMMAKKKTKKSGTAFAGGVSLDFGSATTGHNSTKMNMTYLKGEEEVGGKVIVIDPKPYFFLTQGQLAEIGSLLRASVQKKLDEMSI